MRALSLQLKRNPDGAAWSLGVDVRAQLQRTLGRVGMVFSKQPITRGFGPPGPVFRAVHLVLVWAGVLTKPRTP